MYQVGHSYVYSVGPHYYYPRYVLYLLIYFLIFIIFPPRWSLFILEATSVATIWKQIMHGVSLSHLRRGQGRRVVGWDGRGSGFSVTFLLPLSTLFLIPYTA